MLSIFLISPHNPPMRQHIIVVRGPDGFPIHALRTDRAWSALLRYLRWRGLGRVEWAVRRKDGVVRRVV